jgi:hypothetical protein
MKEETKMDFALQVYIKDLKRRAPYGRRKTAMKSHQGG